MIGHQHSPRQFIITVDGLLVCDLFEIPEAFEESVEILSADSDKNWSEATHLVDFKETHASDVLLVVDHVASAVLCKWRKYISVGWTTS